MATDFDRNLFMVGLKERGFKNSYRSNLLSQLPTSTPFVNQNGGERYYPRHNYVQLSRSFDFAEFGNHDAPRNIQMFLIKNLLQLIPVEDLNVLQLSKKEDWNHLLQPIRVMHLLNKVGDL
ncbi:hypothetical protein CEXT_304851 [Caerostris extrusa]|uniref:Uncharacterized protein n=1 Tax=Caerostris extrusa TaxID=172846 RepID=A0AAV4XGF3_CAEEX|nr:hypothetical protein CEXT_304851 [Caerostris extrusa]